MRPLNRHLSVLLVSMALLGSSGCAMFQVLHPSNTWKLNRGPAMDEGDAYFSVSDPAATLPGLQPTTSQAAAATSHAD